MKINRIYSENWGTTVSRIPSIAFSLRLYRVDLVVSGFRAKGDRVPRTDRLYGLLSSYGFNPLEAVNLNIGKKRKSRRKPT